MGGAPGNAGTPATGGAQDTSASAGRSTGGAGGAAQSAGNCTPGKWLAADPTATGPFATVTENEVGPEAGEADADTGAVPKFTLFRPKDMSPNGLCHPVITWGNGTGSTPNLYRSLLGLFASHGFVVIASNSKNVSRGDPKPMLVGVTWILQQNEDPTSVLYHHLDPARIGATGHSQGAMATSQAAGDARITTNVPIEGAMVQRNLHGPSMFFCGGLDDIVGCDGAKSALNAVTTLPAMYAEYLSVDHGSWMSFNNKPSVVYGAITAWMRVHLMGDDSLRPWFYGEACQLCADTGWQIQQKNMAP
jgi:dienelactone hydrolase